RDNTPGIVSLTDVGRDEPAALVSDQARFCLARRFLDVGDHHLGALGHVAPGDRKADAARATRDNGYLSVEQAHGCSLTAWPRIIGRKPMALRPQPSRAAPNSAAGADWTRIRAERRSFDRANRARHRAAQWRSRSNPTSGCTRSRD